MLDRRRGVDRRLYQRDTPDRRITPTAECRDCGADSKVIRTIETEGPIIRRRQCVGCGKRWNTHEVFDEA